TVVLQKCAVVGAGTERADAQIRARTRFLAFGNILGTANLPQLRALPDGELRFGILYVARDIVDEFFQRVRTIRAEIAAAVGVGIYVHDRVRFQFVGMLFSKFGGANQS